MFKQGLSVTFGLFYKIKLCLLFAQLINFLPQLYSKIFKSIPTKQAVYQTHSIFEPASPIVYWLHWVCDHSFCCSLAIEILIETGFYCLLSKIWLALSFWSSRFCSKWSLLPPEKCLSKNRVLLSIGLPLNTQLYCSWF